MTKFSLNASKKTKHTPAGEIPVDWACVKLGDTLNAINSGFSVNAENKPIVSGEVGILKLNAVSKGRFFPDRNKHIPDSELSKAKTNPKKGCVVITRSNTPELVGEVGLIKESHTHLFLPDTMWQLMFNESKSTPHWINYILSSTPYRQRLQLLATGTSANMKKLQKGVIVKIPIPLPPLPEQRKIAALLSTWDTALEKLDALIAAKTRRKQALMQQLLTGKKRLPGFTKEWVEKQLGDILINRRENNRPDLELLSITAKKGVIRRDELVKKDSSNEDKSKYLRIAPNDIGYNTMRMWQGVSALSELEGIVSPAYTICTPIEELSGKFIAHLFKTPKVISLFHRHSQGLVADTLNLKYPNFAKIHIVIPATKEEQQAIAEVLDTADNELRILKKQRIALEQQKRGLMQQLLTGKVRIAV